MRPPSIVLFEKLFLTSIAIGVLNTVLSWGVISRSAENPALEATGLGPELVLISVVIQVLLSLLLWYFIARRASTVAKWIYVVLTAFGLLALLQALANALTPWGVTLVLSVVALSLQIFAAWLLFKPDAKAWFAGKGGDPADPGPTA